jgi:hypothetical protein
VPAERELGIDPVLPRAEPQLLEPGDLVADELLAGEVVQRRAPPERQRLL